MYCRDYVDQLKSKIEFYGKPFM